MWDEIIYPFPNFNGCTIEVWEWISNFTPHFIMDVITYPCWGSAFLFPPASVPPFPTAGLHRHGHHHHETQALLDATSLPYHLDDCLSWGRWTTQHGTQTHWVKWQPLCWWHFQVHFLEITFFMLIDVSVQFWYLHIEAATKWPPFCWRHFEIHFLEWKCMNVD